MQNVNIFIIIKNIGKHGFELILNYLKTLVFFGNMTMTDHGHFTRCSYL